MSDNPNIQRISLEEIQELKDLNLFDLQAGANPYELVLMAYNPATGKFMTTTINTDPTSDGAISVTFASVLEKDVTVLTEKMSAEKGFIFKKDSTLQDVVSLLANPKTAPKVVIDEMGEFIEVNKDFPYSITYSYAQNDGGESDSDTEGFMLDGGATVSTSSVKVTVETDVIFSALVDTAENDYYPATRLQGDKILKAVYPCFTGLGNGPVVDDFINPILADIKGTSEIILSMPEASEGISQYWFATHMSNSPKTWQNIIDTTEGGKIDSLFVYTKEVIYNGNIYKVYVTDATLFTEDIKIKF